MRVDQPRNERLFTEIDDFAGMVSIDFRKCSDIRDPISFDCDGAVLDGRSIHRYDEACADNHFSAVAAVYDRRKYRWKICDAHRALLQTERAFALHHFATFRHEQTARFLAKQRNHVLILTGLVM